jgi:hypothetical protein
LCHVKLLKIEIMANGFNSQKWNDLQNKSNFIQKCNGIILFVGAKLEALSSKLGFEELAYVKDVDFTNEELCVFVEFIGDTSTWNEWVSVNNCKPFNIF